MAGDFNVKGTGDWGGPTIAAGTDPGHGITTAPITPAAAGFTDPNGVYRIAAHVSSDWTSDRFLEPAGYAQESIPFNGPGKTYDFNIYRFPVIKTDATGQVYEGFGGGSDGQNLVHVIIMQLINGFPSASKEGYDAVYVRGAYDGNPRADNFNKGNVGTPPDYSQLYWLNLTPGQTIQIVDSFYRTVTFTPPYYADQNNWNPGDFRWSGDLSEGRWGSGGTHADFSGGGRISATVTAPSGYGQTKIVTATYHRRRGQYMIGGSSIGYGGYPLEYDSTCTWTLTTVEDPAIQAFAQRTFDNMTGTADTRLTSGSYTLSAPAGVSVTGLRTLKVQCVGTDGANDSTAGSDTIIVTGPRGQSSTVRGDLGATVQLYAGESFSFSVMSGTWETGSPRKSVKRTYRVIAYKGASRSSEEAWTSAFVVYSNPPDVTPNPFNSISLTDTDKDGSQTVVVTSVPFGNGTSLQGLGVSGNGTQATSYMRLLAPDGYSGTFTNGISTVNSWTSRLVGGTWTIVGSGGVIGCKNGEVLSVTLQRPKAFATPVQYRIDYGCMPDGSNGVSSITITLTSRGQIYIPGDFTVNDELNMEPNFQYIQFVSVGGFDGVLSYSTTVTNNLDGWRVEGSGQISSGGQMRIAVFSPPDIYYPDVKAEKTWTVIATGSNGSSITKTFKTRLRTKKTSTTAAFITQSGLSPGAAAESNEVTLTGFDGNISISPAAGADSMVYWGPSNKMLVETSGSATVTSGVSVKLKTTASASFGGSKTVSLYNNTSSSTIGSWTLNTVGAPTGGGFTSQYGLEPGTTVNLTSAAFSGLTTYLNYSISPATRWGWSSAGSGNVGPGGSMSVSVSTAADDFGSDENGAIDDFVVTAVISAPDKVIPATQGNIQYWQYTDSEDYVHKEISVFDSHYLPRAPDRSWVGKQFPTQQPDKPDAWLWTYIQYPDDPITSTRRKQVYFEVSTTYRCVPSRTQGTPEQRIAQPGTSLTFPFSIGTRAADKTINPVTFNSTTDAVPGNDFVSNTVSMTGFDLSREISCTNGLIEVNGSGPKTDRKWVRRGDTVKIYATSPMDFSESKTITLNQVNPSQVLGTWTITNKVCDDIALLMDL